MLYHAAEPPRMDTGELLLNKAFLERCSQLYGATSRTLENHGQAFVSKHFNVIDPLRTNSNLKGNYLLTQKSQDSEIQMNWAEFMLASFAFC